MTPLWKWLMANLPLNILPVLLSCCREWGGEQRHTGLVEHPLKWLATPQNVRLFGMMPQAFISFYSSSWFFPTSHICVLFGFSSTQFTMFHWNPIAVLMSEFWGWSVLLGFVFHLFSVWFGLLGLLLGRDCLCMWFIGGRGCYLRGIFQW